MKKTKFPKIIGQRVEIISSTHPWHGERGTAVELNQLITGTALKIDLDNGHSCYCLSANDFKKLEK